jgi:hypothetical protein
MVVSNGSETARTRPRASLPCHHLQHVTYAASGIRNAMSISLRVFRLMRLIGTRTMPSSPRVLSNIQNEEFGARTRAAGCELIVRESLFVGQEHVAM